MIKKAISLTSFAAGYVLGARAGRERYEQIRKAAIGIKNDPRIQEKVLHHDAAPDADLRPHGASLSEDPLGAGSLR